MRPREIAVLSALLALVASGAYVFVYLYRWEWNRALIAGVIFIATEVGLAGGMILDRLRRIEARLDSDGTATALRHVRATASPPHDAFAWLSPRQGGGQLHVFVPVLLGAGLMLSALAWLVERVARVTARPVLEQHLARRLGRLCLPSDGLVDHDPDGLALLRGRVNGA